MKKSYLMIAAAAALFAACAQNDIFNDVDTQEVPIAFDQALNKVTRAHISNNAALAAEGGFVVYGYKTLDSWSSSSTVFDAINVTSQNGTTWAYSGLRFWDKNATYNFFAVAPYAPSYGVTYAISNATNGYFTISNVKSGKAEYSDDFLIDFDGNKGVLGSAHTSTSNPAVGFEFHHIMAKVTFSLKSSLASGTIVVNELKMSGYNSNVGTYTQANATTPTARPQTIETSGWSQTAGTAGEVYLIHEDSTLTSVSVPCDGTTIKPLISETNGTNEWCIMVPQTIAANGLTFTVTYTYTGTDNYTETFTNQTATLTNAQTWGTDSYTNYTLDINPVAITFNVTSICSFDVDGGYADEVEVE